MTAAATPTATTASTTKFDTFDEALYAGHVELAGGDTLRFWDSYGIQRPVQQQTLPAPVLTLLAPTHQP